MKTIYAEDIAAEMSEMARRLSSETLAGPLAELVPILRTGFARNFQQQVDSRGGGWPARQDTDPHPLLIETEGPGAGALLAAATGEGPGAVEQVADRALAVGVDKGIDLGGIPGAAVHNFGYPTGHIPQREYLYASEDTLDACCESLADGALIVVFVF